MTFESLLTQVMHTHSLAVRYTCRSTATTEEDVVCYEQVEDQRDIKTHNNLYLLEYTHHQPATPPLSATSPHLYPIQCGPFLLQPASLHSHDLE